MIEMFEEQYKYPFKSQERMEWYQINHFLQNVAIAAAELGLAPEDMVHIGGTANFYRAYKVFGATAVFHFRGTHDMDVVSFNQGRVQQVLEKVKTMPESPISGYTMRKSPGLEDKKSVYLELRSTMPGLSTGFEMDVYEPLDRLHAGVIRFNERLITKNKIVLDPPELLVLPKHRGLVAVPSLRDYFVMKMDIVDYSRSGLRPKDQMDILTIIRICEVTGVNFDKLLESLVSTSSKASIVNKLYELDQLISNPSAQLGIISEDHPFLPTDKMRSEVLFKIKSARAKASDTLIGKLKR